MNIFLAMLIGAFWLWSGNPVEPGMRSFRSLTPDPRPLLTGDPADPASAPVVVYWHGVSGGLQWRWTSDDITARNGAGRLAYSVKRTLKQEAKVGAEHDTDVNSYWEVNCRMLSVVGSLLSYERDDYWEGGAHPSGSEAFIAFDASNPGKPLALTDLFPDAQILRALLADPIVQRVRKQANLKDTPATSAQLAKQLAEQTFDAADGINYSFPPDLLRDFAFHHIENGKVAIRFCLPHGSEIYRFHHTQLGILLPIPAALRPALTRASHRQEGYLMQDLPKIARTAQTKVVLIERHVLKSQ